MRIIQYDNYYRDDMIFMVLQAKDVLGRKPTWFESYNFYPKHGYTEYAPRYMMKNL